MPKIISERCELLKLCHINCSGPVFLRQCIWSLQSVKKYWLLIRYVDLDSRHTDRHRDTCTDARKTGMVDLTESPRWWKTSDNMFRPTSFDTIYERDGQTPHDGILYAALCIVSRTPVPRQNTVQRTWVHSTFIRDVRWRHELVAKLVAMPTVSRSAASARFSRRRFLRRFLTKIPGFCYIATTPSMTSSKKREYNVLDH